MTLVFNASPLIVLAKAGLLDRLVAPGDRIIIPRAVVDEVVRVDDPADPARIWLENPPLPFASPVAPDPSPFLAAWDLGAGESGVIALAATIPGATAVLDDLAARRCAQAHGIQVVGSLGLVLLGKKRGLVSAVAEALGAIQGAGLFVSPRILSDILRKAGE